MSEPTPEPAKAPVVTNGGTVGVVINAGSKMLGALPSQFLALCVLNAIFLGIVFWFEHAQTEARVEVIRDMLHACTVRLERAQ